MNIRTILWPTDFSDDSKHAFDHAAAVARWYSARIVALHAVTQVFADVAAGGFAPVDADPGEMIGSQISRSPSAVGVAIDSATIDAPAPTGIVQYASQHPIDLIVMGTHGASGFQHLVLGSVTEKVLRKARCPVLTVPPRARATSSLPFKHIVCPCDFSASSIEALRVAVSFAQEGDASLTLVHVLEDSDENELFVARPYDVHRHRELRSRHAAEQMAQLVSGTATHIVVGPGRPCDEILRVADEENADMIVMGVQGRTALDLMMFGSTTNQIVRRATCPVLTVRRPAAA